MSYFLFILNCGSLSLILWSPVHLSLSRPCKWNKKTAGETQPLTRTRAETLEIQDPHCRFQSQPCGQSEPSDSQTLSHEPAPPQCVHTWRHCYTLVNLLNTTLRAICIVANGILLGDRNHWVLKGIMSVTATMWRILLNCHRLTCCGCCSVLSIFVFSLLNNLQSLL